MTQASRFYVTDVIRTYSKTYSKIFCKSFYTIKIQTYFHRVVYLNLYFRYEKGKGYLYLNT